MKLTQIYQVSLYNSMRWFRIIKRHIGRKKPCSVFLWQMTNSNNLIIYFTKFGRSTTFRFKYITA